MTDTLVFNPIAHRYSIGTRELISVTQALTEAGLIDTRWFNDEAALRGSYVHQAILLHVEGDLADDQLDPVLQPYFAAYQRFLTESGFVVTACETRLYDDIVGYAGTVDLVGTLNGRSAVIDIKTGHCPSWVSLQLAGYARLLSKQYPGIQRYALNLQADVTYRLHRFTDRHDEQVFLAAVAVTQWRRTHAR